MVNSFQFPYERLRKFFGLVIFIGCLLLGLASLEIVEGVSSEHGDLGTISFHLTRKTKTHMHLHKHNKFHNRTSMINGAVRSKEGYSLRVRIAVKALGKRKIVK